MHTFWNLDIRPVSFDNTSKIIENLCLYTPFILEIIWVKNVRAIVVCGFLMKSLKKHILKV
jgi:hypothetical protein